jgi:transposase
MAMGKRRGRQRQEELWVASSQIVQSSGHVFYNRLNAILETHRFDARVEQLCRRFYKGPSGQPSLPPGVYFRCLLVGFFEGLDSERGIAWRVADSLSLRKFLGYGLDESTPDHSTISRTRRLFWLSTHQAVFRWVLRVLRDEGLLKGKTIAIDATTLEANAAMRAIVRRDTGEAYDAYLTRLMAAAGIAEPTREQRARFDRKRKKKGSNKEWMHPQDPEARITKMKDGRTHLAYKAEHAVDVAGGAVLTVTLHPADAGDTTTGIVTLDAAQATAQAVALGPVEEVVLDKGYHSDAVLGALQERDVRSYVSEPARGRRRWQQKAAQQHQVYANRRRGRGPRNRRLQKRRAELCERSHAHLYETGGMRRVHLRGRANILKRLLIHTAGFNLALLLRQVCGVGTPRGLQGGPTVAALVRGLATPLTGLVRGLRDACSHAVRRARPIAAGSTHAVSTVHVQVRNIHSTTGC